MNMNATCINQYGQPAAAGFTNSHNAYSWYCYRYLSQARLVDRIDGASVRERQPADPRSGHPAYL